MELSVAEFERLGLQAPDRRTPIPHGPQTLADMLDPWLARTPRAEALVGRHERYTYAQLDGAVNAAAAGLAGAGLRQGQVVAASTGNHPDIVVAFLAAQRIGAIWAGLNRSLSGPEKAWMLRHSGANLLLADGETLSQLARVHATPPITCLEMNGNGVPDSWRELCARHAAAARISNVIDPWAPALLSYTSGTTGVPKGVVHSQRNAVLIGAAAVHRNQWDIRLRRGSAQPLTINNILIRFATASLYAGACFVCMDRMDAPGTIEWVARERIQAFSAVPTMVYDLLMDPKVDLDALPSLVRPIVGAARMSDQLRLRFRERFKTDLQFTYGLTEAPTGTTQTDPDEPFVPGSSGRALPHLRVAIMGTDGQLLPAESEGEIVIGPQTQGYWAHVYTPTLGYWHDLPATRALLRDGWLHTGDIGLLDDAGHLYVKDRRTDLIVRGGANVYPAEIEHTIGSDDRVRACAVIGIPDERLGERVGAVVELQVGLPNTAKVLQQLHATCSERHAGYKVPVLWFAVEDMPRNAMNKVVKPLLKQRVAAGEIPLSWSAPRRG